MPTRQQSGLGMHVSGLVSTSGVDLLGSKVLGLSSFKVWAVGAGVVDFRVVCCRRSFGGPGDTFQVTLMVSSREGGSEAEGGL